MAEKPSLVDKIFRRSGRQPAVKSETTTGMTDSRMPRASEPVLDLEAVAHDAVPADPAPTPLPVSNHPAPRAPEAKPYVPRGGRGKFFWSVRFVPHDALEDVLQQLEDFGWEIFDVEMVGPKATVIARRPNLEWEKS